MLIEKKYSHLSICLEIIKMICNGNSYHCIRAGLSKRATVAMALCGQSVSESRTGAKRDVRLVTVL